MDIHKLSNEAFIMSLHGTLAHHLPVLTLPFVDHEAVTRTA